VVVASCGAVKCSAGIASGSANRPHFGAGKLYQHERYLYTLSDIDGEQHNGTGEYLHLLLVQVLLVQALETGEEVRRTKTSDRCRQMCRMKYQHSQCVSRSDRIHRFVLKGRCAVPCHARRGETIGTSAVRCQAQMKRESDPCDMCTSELHTAAYYF